MKHNLALLMIISLLGLAFCEYNTYRGSNQNQQRVQYGTKDDLEWSGYSYSIDEGNCDGNKMVDEEIEKEATPYTYKKTTYTWTGRGMFYVTCIRVLNRMPRDNNAAEARISEGGVGQDSVRIEMRSQDSQKTQFHVEIYGKPKLSQANNMAVMTNSASSMLYMNGKKYCECR